MSYAIHKLTYSDGRAYCYHISDDTGKLHYVAERTGLLLPSPTRLVEFFDSDKNLLGRLQPPDVPPWVRATRYEVFVGEDAEEPSAAILETYRLVDILLLQLPRYEVRFGQHHYVIRGSRYGERFYEIFHPPDQVEEAQEDQDDVEEEVVVVEEIEAKGGAIWEREEAIRASAGLIRFEADESQDENEKEDEDEKSLALETDVEFDEKLLEAQEEEDTEREKTHGTKVGEIYRPTVGPSYVIETDAAPLRQSLLTLAAVAILIDMQLHA